MNSFGWLNLVYLLMVLGLLFGAYRSHNIGGKKTLAYALIWVAIFGIVALFAKMVTE